MKSIFQRIDIFGTKFNFRMNDNENFKTPLGGVFTIMTISIIIVFAFFFGQDFYYGTNPTVYSTTVEPVKYDPPMQLNPNNFILAWRIENNDKALINTTGYIYPMMYHFRFKKLPGFFVGCFAQKRISNTQTL